MKTMIYSDYITIRSALIQSFIIAVALGCFLAIPLGSTAAVVAMVVVIIDMGATMNLCAYDDVNDWQRFRLTMPLSRRQVVVGRYMSVALIMVCVAVLAVLIGLVLQLLLGNVLAIGDFTSLSLSTIVLELVIAAILATCITLIDTGITLPLMVRFGMTKATRFIMPVMAVVLLFALQALGSIGLDSGSLESMVVSFLGVNSLAEIGLDALMGCALVCALVCVVLYVISSSISIRLYQTKQF
ncbi:ABC-2 transporter permease [Eggerthellaceae bacterium 3-80]|nr:ABC-2 transporter permease [bacterium D16-34]